jgi:hypothetical protein
MSGNDSDRRRIVFVRENCDVDHVYSATKGIIE